MSKKIVFITMLVLVVVTMSGCVPGSGRYTMDAPAGFFSGVWHGWIAPLTLIGSLFSDKISMYEVVNKGWSYDFGFYIAIISGFGGISLSRKKKKD